MLSLSPPNKTSTYTGFEHALINMNIPEVASSLESRINDTFQVLKPQFQVDWVYISHLELKSHFALKNTNKNINIFF